MTTVRRLVIVLVMSAAVTASDPARGYDSVPSPTRDLIALADATVSAKMVAVECLVVPGGQANEYTFDIAKVLCGEIVKAGQRVRLRVPSRMPFSGQVLLVLIKSKDGTIEAGEVLPDPDGRLFDHFAAARAIPETDYARRIAFFGPRMEDAHPEIASDALDRMGAVPSDKIRSEASRLPADKLRGWLADAEVPLSRKGFYATLLGVCGEGAANSRDIELLRRVAKQARKNHTAAAGAFAGLIDLTGRPQDVLGPVIGDPRASVTTGRAAMYAVRLSWYGADARRHAELTQLLRAGLTNPKTAEFAVEEAARIGISDLDEDVKRLWLDPIRNTRDMRIFIRFYAAVRPDPQRREFVKWMEQNPAPPLPAEK